MQTVQMQTCEEKSSKEEGSEKKEVMHNLLNILL